MLWPTSSDVLFTLGGDCKTSPNCFSAGYIPREFEVPTTAGSFLRLLHLTKSSMMEDNLKAIHAALNFEAF